MDAKRGPTATVLVQSGVVKIGDFIGTASAGGKIRILEDFQGNPIRAALPSTPAVIGFSKAPRVGDRFSIFKDEEALGAHIQEEKPREKVNIVTLDPESKVVNIIVKADVAGSLEALEDVLKNLSQDTVALRIVETGVGEVLENDVKLARSAHAHIFSFRAKVSTAALDGAGKAGVSIQKFSIIYELIQAVRELMEQAAKEEEGGRKDVGSLLVLAVFLTDKKRQVIGGKVLEGEVHKGVRVEVVREGAVFAQGRITNVQRDKKDVPIAGKNQECGLSYEGAEKIQAGDTLQFYIEKLQP
jgi:translation initiation factor IF-2